MKKIFTTTGCYGTGSSAITDLIREFDDITCVGDKEIRILHDPDGVSDLEYNLVENPNRHNSSNSIKNFKKRMYELDHVFFVPRFCNYFQNQFLQVVNKYIEKITICSYVSCWHYDVYNRGKIFYIGSRCYKKSCEILSKILHKRISGLDPITKKEIAYLTTTDEEVFLKATRELVNDLAEAIDINERPYVFMDQLVPPCNFERYLRYIDDVRVVLVERDPRDVFLQEKYVYKGTVAPTQSVKKFCEWYLWTRSLYNRDELPEPVLYIQFEDLIYKYDETREKILEHFGIQDLECKNYTKYFNPKISVVNTQLWKSFKGEETNMCYIKNRLSNYCYDYSLVDEIIPDGKAKIF